MSIAWKNEKAYRINTFYEIEELSSNDSDWLNTGHSMNDSGKLLSVGSYFLEWNSRIIYIRDENLENINTLSPQDIDENISSFKFIEFHNNQYYIGVSTSDGKYEIYVRKDLN